MLRAHSGGSRRCRREERVAHQSLHTAQLHGLSRIELGREGIERDVTRVKALALLAAAGVAAGGAAAGSSYFGGRSATLGCSGSEYVSYPERPLALRRDEGHAAGFLRDFDPSLLHRGAAVDEIRAIDRPCFEVPHDSSRLLQPTDLVVGLTRGGEAHAYPINLLSLHEVVNDVVGNQPVAVTWCPLCSTALGFERLVGGRELHFGVSGYLYRANQILFDRESRSLWSQLLDGAVTGRYRGTALKPVPLAEETWQAWRSEHPNTVVLSIRNDAYASWFTHPFTRRLGNGFEDSDEPFSFYASKVGVYFPQVVRGVPGGDLVLGTVLGGRPKAYALVTLQRLHAVDDVVSAEPVLVTYDDSALAASLFSRRVQGRVLTFRPERSTLADAETHSRWSPTTGRALAGPFRGTTLKRLPATQSYWFAWRSIYPRTAVLP
jgi:Protein of unknown function (DUF3179)